MNSYKHYVNLVIANLGTSHEIKKKRIFYVYTIGLYVLYHELPTVVRMITLHYVFVQVLIKVEVILFFTKKTLKHSGLLNFHNLYTFKRC